MLVHLCWKRLYSDNAVVEIFFYFRAMMIVTNVVMCKMVNTAYQSALLQNMKKMDYATHAGRSVLEVALDLAMALVLGHAISAVWLSFLNL